MGEIIYLQGKYTLQNAVQLFMVPAFRILQFLATATYTYMYMSGYQKLPRTYMKNDEARIEVFQIFPF